MADISAGHAKQSRQPQTGSQKSSCDTRVQTNTSKNLTEARGDLPTGTIPFKRMIGKNNW